MPCRSRIILAFLRDSVRGSFKLFQHGQTSIQESPDYSSEVDFNPPDMVRLAGSMLSDFNQSVNLSNLNTIIFLYQKAISAEKLETLRQLATAHLIRFWVTGSEDELQASTSFSRQLYMAKPNYVSCLCAVLLTNPGVPAEAVSLMKQALESDLSALELN
ncbi:hypothetical protein B0H13DRAFT_2303897 [Mycena leptocephala]|nr:hypothetical protein B0H13DRAFT_2303897 [Mycena leptocephala]